MNVAQLTTPTSAKNIKREWYIFDMKDQTLGRQASAIAKLLMGKAKPYYVRNLDCGDYVVVVNAKEIKVTGKKEENKVYVRHSGYPGGFRSETLKELRGRRPQEIVRRAVKGMLPDNRLGDHMLKRLFIFTEGEHTYTDKKFVNS